MPLGVKRFAIRRKKMSVTDKASLMCCLREVDEPRKPSNGTLHDFVEILVIATAAVFSDCETIEDIAFWGHNKQSWLREFLVLKNGVPSKKTFLRIFQALDPKQFEVAFRRWVAEVVGALRRYRGRWKDRAWIGQRR